MIEATNAALEVGKEHGFSAMLVVCLLIAIGCAAWLMIRTHIKVTDRLAAAQEKSYDNHVQFAKETGQATKQMASSTETIERAISMIVDVSAARHQTVEDIKRRSLQIHRAAKGLIDVAAEHLDKTEPRVANILRRVADELDKE